MAVVLLEFHEYFDRLHIQKYYSSQLYSFSNLYKTCTAKSDSITRDRLIFGYWNLTMLHIINVSCWLTTLQKILSRKFDFPSRSSKLWNFFFSLHAKSSVILWFKARLRTEFSYQILQESVDFLELVNEDKNDGQLGRILGIAPSWYFMQPNCNWGLYLFVGLSVGLSPSCWK